MRDAKRPASPELRKIGAGLLSWRLAKMDVEGDWSCHSIGATALRDAGAKLAELEKLTWAEATARASARMTRIPTPKLPPKARRRLEQLKLDDFGELYEIRVAGKPRIWGVREEPVFYFLWWDPNHEVYPARLRNT